MSAIGFSHVTDRSALVCGWQIVVGARTAVRVTATCDLHFLGRRLAGENRPRAVVPVAWKWALKIGPLFVTWRRPPRSRRQFADYGVPSEGWTGRRSVTTEFWAAA